MRISHFFIDRPIFAAVISVVFVIVGAVSFFRLPVAQYPEIAPPIINVSGQYPGASADVVASTVVSPIEDQLNGVVNIHSPDKSRDSLFLSNYSTLEIKDALTRVDGVGSIIVFGGRDFAMRIWLDPDRLQSLNMTASDVVASLQGQNIQVASGVLNQQPMTNPGAFEIAVQTQGRLAEPDQFSEIVVKQTPGALVRLKDVARVELAAQDYSTNSYLDHDPAVALAIFQRPGSNALTTSKSIIATMDELAKRFPAGIEHTIVYNPTEFIQQSVNAVMETIGEAIILVVLVVILFLQTWRAAIIPIVAIPVSLVGTFFFMAMF